MNPRNREERRKQRLVELAQGVYVEQDVLGIVRRIMERWPNLSVKYLDPNSAPDITDTPYRIVETGPDGFERVVFGCWTLDETVIQRLEAGDTWKVDVLAELELKNKRAKEAEEKKRREEVAAQNEMIVDVLKSPKDTYSAVDPVTGKKHVFSETNPKKKPPEKKILT